MAVVLVAVMAAACGGGSGRAAQPAPPPAPGHGTPQAATVGFIRGLAAGAKNACVYVAPQNLVPCASAFPASTTFSIANLGMGTTTIRGTQAVVTITGKFCTTQAGQTNCATNSNLTTGQPDAATAAAFSAAYHPATQESIGHRAIPCQDIGGQWYVDLLG
jgi:hypothetical protein